MNQVTAAHGGLRLWKDSFYVGPIGPYDMEAVRKGLGVDRSPHRPGSVEGSASRFRKDCRDNLLHGIAWVIRGTATIFSRSFCFGVDLRELFER